MKYNDCVSNKGLLKGLLEECDKEESLEVLVLPLLLFEKGTIKVLSNATYSLSHRHAGAPMINIQSTLRTAPDVRKNVSLTLSYYLVATVIHMQSLRSQICVYIYIHIFFTIQRRCSGKDKGIEVIVNAACQI